MVTAVDAVALAGLVVGNAAIAALATRFFRVRMHTQWGSALYTLVVGPVLMLIPIYVVSGVLKLGPDLGSAGAVVALTVVLPLAAGVTFDYFWMPAPDEVELPEGWERGRSTERGGERR